MFSWALIKCRSLFKSKHIVEHRHVVEPGLDAVSCDGQPHVVPSARVHAARARGRLRPDVAADLLDGVLRVAACAEVQLTVVLPVHIVEHDDEALRSAVLAGMALDGVVVGGDDVVADGERSLLARLDLRSRLLTLG